MNGTTGWQLPEEVEVPPSGSSVEQLRAKFAQAGGQALDDQELLAVLLGAGNGRGPAATVRARRALDATGCLHRLLGLDTQELAALPGMGPLRACLLKAAAELGRRVAAPAPRPGKPLRSATDVACWFRCQLQDHERECIHALLLDGKHRPMANVRITEGSWTSCPVDPKVVYAACLRRGAPFFILVHNHPSGDPSPSRDDLQLTERMLRAGEVVGVRMLDHIIVGREGTVSLADMGVL